ncbi:hypothetical protein F5Y16DRAFT_414808 [Xylariaceae sp. FL0255]|nr:hypothetical protein F5Y16DRAFT_414808 [Xylariaceae sp. FL0255]
MTDQSRRKFREELSKYILASCSSMSPEAKAGLELFLEASMEDGNCNVLAFHMFCSTLQYIASAITIIPEQKVILSQLVHSLSAHWTLESSDVPSQGDQRSMNTHLKLFSKLFGDSVDSPEPIITSSSFHNVKASTATRDAKNGIDIAGGMSSDNQDSNSILDLPVPQLAIEGSLHPSTGPSTDGGLASPEVVDNTLKNNKTELLASRGASQNPSGKFQIDGQHIVKDNTIGFVPAQSAQESAHESAKKKGRKENNCGKIVPQDLMDRYPFASKIMQKQGWNGNEGLGINNDGIKQPVLPDLTTLVVNSKEYNNNIHPGPGFNKNEKAPSAKATSARKKTVETLYIQEDHSADGWMETNTPVSKWMDETMAAGGFTSPGVSSGHDNNPGPDSATAPASVHRSMISTHSKQSRLNGQNSAGSVTNVAPTTAWHKYTEDPKAGDTEAIRHISAMCQKPTNTSVPPKPQETTGPLDLSPRAHSSGYYKTAKKNTGRNKFWHPRDDVVKDPPEPEPASEPAAHYIPRGWKMGPTGAMVPDLKPHNTRNAETNPHY